MSKINEDKIMDRGYLRRHAIRVIIIALIAFFGLYLITKYFALTPSNNGQEIALSAIIGILGIELLGFILHVSLKSTIKSEESGTLRNLFRIIGYSILTLFLLSLFSVNITGLLVSAGFLGVVFGLAAQSTLSNFIAGVYLLSSKAFEPGDRVTIHTWQYNMIPQSYPHDKFVPGFSGKIKNLGLLYTELTNDENIPVYVPNSIVVQALVLNYRRATEDLIKLQFDLSVNISYENIKKVISDVLKSKNITKYHIGIEYLHNDIYVVTVSLVYDFKDRRELRSEIYENIIEKYLKKSSKSSKSKK